MKKILLFMSLFYSLQLFTTGQELPSLKEKEINILLMNANSLAPPITDPAKCPPSYFFPGTKPIVSYAQAGALLISSFHNIYPGIDLAVYGDGQGLEYVFLVYNGGDPEQIRFYIKEDTSIAKEIASSFVRTIGNTEIVISSPVAFWISDHSKQQIPISYKSVSSSYFEFETYDLVEKRTKNLNNTIFNIIPAKGQPNGPAYDYYIAKFETTHEQFLTFLNDAQAAANTLRGQFMFFDDKGNVWINPAMQKNRDELFEIKWSYLVYYPNKKPGERYDHVRTKEGITPFAKYPILGVSWYGAVKYCNWLTLYAGRGAAQICYSEGTNSFDWAPIIATNWNAGVFNDAERYLLLQKQGFRLPMVNSQPPIINTNKFNEFHKAASWNGYFSALYGFGRNSGNKLDANVATIEEKENIPLPIGIYNGNHLRKNKLLRRDDNYFGLRDISGNAAEWLNDPAGTNIPLHRMLAGGSFDRPLTPVNHVIARPAHDTLSASGIRPVTTYMPDEYLRIHVFFTFYLSPEETMLAPTEGLLPRKQHGEEIIKAEEEYEELPKKVEPIAQPEEFGIIYKEKPELPPPPLPPTEEEITTEGGPSAAGGGGGGGPPPPPAGITLRVIAIAPGGAASITISPSDLLGRSNGTTPFVRIYTNGTTIDITASLTASGWEFVEWLINGNPFPGNNSPYQQFTLIGNVTLTAVYQIPPTPGPWTLSVRASAPGGAVPISVVPADLFGNGSGTTPFLRSYDHNTSVTLMTPPTASGWQFIRWEINGTTFTGNSNTTQNITMTNNTIMMAIYQYVPPIIIDPPVSAGGL